MALLSDVFRDPKSRISGIWKIVSGASTFSLGKGLAASGSSAGGPMVLGEAVSASI